MRTRLKRNKTGFTLVELSISLAFIAVLSITIALITTHMISSYQRGLVLKQVNSSGSEIVEDLRSAIAGSSAKSIVEMCETVYKSDGTTSDYSDCKADNAYRFTNIKSESVVTIIGAKDGGGDETITAPLYGAFCSGTYSYIWNSGYVLAKDKNKYSINGFSYNTDGTTTATAVFKYHVIGEENPRTITDFRLLKILDPSRSVCVAKVREGGSYTSDSETFGSTFVVGEGYGRFEEPATDLISSVGNNDLAIYDLDIFSTLSENSLTGNVFYSGSFILATIAGGVNIKTSGNFCTTPDEYAGDDFDYCAINKFNFAAQAVGE